MQRLIISFLLSYKGDLSSPLSVSADHFVIWSLYMKPRLSHFDNTAGCIHERKVGSGTYNTIFKRLDAILAT